MTSIGAMVAIAIATPAPAQDPDAAASQGRRAAILHREILERQVAFEARLDEIEAAIPTAAQIAREIERREAERIALEDRARRIAAKARADADEADRRRAAYLESNRDAQARAEARPGSGGIIKRGDKTIVVSPSAPQTVAAVVQSPAPVDERGTPPPGFLWLFPMRPGNRQLVQTDPEDLTDQAWRAREIVSAQRAKQRFTFLADKSNPRRLEFNAWLAEHQRAPEFAVLFSVSCWPEVAVAEFARVAGW